MIKIIIFHLKSIKTIIFLAVLGLFWYPIHPPVTDLPVSDLTTVAGDSSRPQDAGDRTATAVATGRAVLGKKPRVIRRKTTWSFGDCRHLQTNIYISIIYI
jgi:hypothetical protein